MREAAIGSIYWSQNLISFSQDASKLFRREVILSLTCLYREVPSLRYLCMRAKKEKAEELEIDECTFLWLIFVR
ncbi:hypothetical protein EYC84_004737 [Monilinia fructicola]|uniref:Uncharacterized protein n=1 Tax=Monilinia fructicola TaxID=38448 RepID=A0A5M9K471_MONFR|nr:hypothetical protein EYC84_004737 [Monilinia fructicola]